MFGALTSEEQSTLAAQFVATSRKSGETLLCKGQVPEAVFLLTSGTVEMTIDEGGPHRVLLRASPATASA